MTAVTEDSPLRQATLVGYHNIGLKLVGLNIDSDRPTHEWTKIYENPNYWNAESLHKEYKYRKFTNVATTFGRSHIKDDLGQNLNLNGCDIDCEEAYKRISMPITETLKLQHVLKDKWLTQKIRICKQRKRRY